MTHVVGLRLVNFQRYRGEHVLELGPGTYAIVAEDEADAQRSNWLGKSSLLMALRYALEGHKPKHFDAVDEMISRGEPEMLVEVELSDGTFVSRKKRRDRPYDLKVEVPCGSEMLELFQDVGQEEIWKRIGFTADDLLNTAYAEQKQLDSLVAAKGTALHDVVVGWLRLEPLVEAADAAGSELKAFSNQLLVIEEKLANARTDPALTWDPAELRPHIVELELQEQDAERRRQANAQRIKEHDAWLVLSEKRKARIAERDAATHALASYESSLAALPLPEGDFLNLELVANRAARALDDAEVEYRKKCALADGRFDGKCPVNGDVCPVSDKINAARARNSQLKKQAVAARADASVLKAKQRAPFDEHVRRKAARERVEVQIAQAEESLARAERQLVALPPLPAEPDVVDIVEGIGVSLELDELRRKLRAAEGAKAQEQELLALAAPFRQKIPIARASLAVLGPEGAQKRVSERAVQAVERVANADLARVGVPLSLAVRWGRETQQPARQCPQCGAAFPASAKAKTCEQCLAPRGMQFKPELRVRLSQVSGAATDLAGLAFRCAAFKWLRQKRQAPWSVAVLDEPFGSLDVSNKRALAAHVQQLVSSTFDQAFVVAHDRALLDGLQRRIVVTGRGDWSSVAVAS